MIHHMGLALVHSPSGICHVLCLPACLCHRCHLPGYWVLSPLVHLQMTASVQNIILVLNNT